MNWHVHCNLIRISRRGFPRRAITQWRPNAPEAELLEKMPVIFSRCPNCGEAPFVPYVRGKVQRLVWPNFLSWFWDTLRGRRWPNCALICRSCSHLVAWERVANDIEVATND